MRWISWTVAVTTVLASVVAVAPTAVAAPAAATRCGFAVDLPIAKRWHALRGERGVLGCPTAAAVDVTNPRGKRQTFENGEVAFSPQQGDDMVVAAYRRGAEVTVDWAFMDGIDHPMFQVRWAHNGNYIGKEIIAFKDGHTGVFTTTVAQGPGRYEFTVEGLDNESHSDRGPTVPVGITIPDYQGKPSGCFVAVASALLQRWHEFGGADGRLGCPMDTGTETNLAPGVRGVRQPFDNGVLTIVLDPAQPTVISAVGVGNDVLVQWGRKGVQYNRFWVEVTHGTHKGTFATRRDALLGGYRSDGSLIVPGGGDFSVTVTGCPTMNPGVCNTYVASTWALIRPKWHTEFSKANTSDPEQSFTTLDRRRAAAVQHFACSRMVDANGPAPNSDQADLHNKWNAGEDTGALITAHLEMVRLKGPDFTCPRQKPSLDYANELLRNLVPHRVGSSWDPIDEGPINCDGRVGDFDTFQKSLPAVMHRYGDLLRPETHWYVKDKLLFVRGPADDFNEKRELCRDIIIPESENHRLMIETTKYLANDLWLPVQNDQRYNNATNGQRDYVLKMLHEYAKHDFMEYNARIYTRYSLHALMNLYDYARDPLVRDAARAVLDYSTTKFALTSNGLRRAGPFRRTTDHDDEHNKTWFSGGSDPLTAFFLMWTGYRPADEDWQQSPWLVEPDDAGRGGWRARDLMPEWMSVESVIIATTHYLPPRVAVQKAMVRDTTFQATFQHGERPKVPYSPDFAMPGIEIYSQSPSFTLTAGGAWLNSGYGNDEIFGTFKENKNMGSPQSTTLMPTRNLPNIGDIGQAVVRNNLIRFDGTGYSDNPDKRNMVNTCVDGGFACGSNMVVPDMWTNCANKIEMDLWMFLDASTDRCGKQGFVVALRFSDHDGKRDGFLYAVEKSKVAEFGLWAKKVRDDNTHLPAVLGQGEFHAFKSPDNGPYVFTVLRKQGEQPYQPMIVQAGDRRIEDHRFNGLARSPWLYSSQYSGYLEIRNPACDSRTVYDFRAALAPQSKTYEWGTCDTAGAQRLVAEATSLWNAGKRDEAVSASVRGINVWREYAAENPSALPGLYEYIRTAGSQYLTQTGKPEAAESLLREAVTGYRHLLITDPGNRDHRYHLAMLLVSLSGLEQKDYPKDAAAHAWEATDLLRRLSVEDSKYQETHGRIILHPTAPLLAATGRGDDALALFREADAVFAELVAREPAKLEHAANRAQARMGVGVRQWERGDRGPGLATVQEAVQMMRDLAGRSQPYSRTLAAWLRSPLQGYLTQVGQIDNAIAALREALTIYDGWISREPAKLDHQADRADTLSQLGYRYWDKGARDQAVATDRSAVDAYRALVGKSPVYRPSLAYSLVWPLSHHLEAVGKKPDAIAGVKEAVELYRVLAREDARHQERLNAAEARLAELQR